MGFRGEGVGGKGGEGCRGGGGVEKGECPHAWA